MERRDLGLGLLCLALAGCSRPATERDFIRVAVAHQIDTLDPHAVDRLSAFSILSNVYEPLVVTDAEMRMRPALAERWESPDPLTWIFHIRPAVTFHSGRALQAADVVYSLTRALGRPELEVKNYLVDVEGVTALDGLTVRLQTKISTRILLNKLRYAYVVPDGSSTEALRGSADGTGPYRLAAWSPRESVRLERNERYWGGPPPVRSVEFVLGASPDEAIRGFLQGRYQLIQADSKKVEVALGAAHRILRRDNFFVKYLGFDLERERTPFARSSSNPFRDLRVRRAIHIGLDRHRLVRELWNYAEPAAQPVPRFVFGFSPGIAEPTYSAGAGMSLLKQAGFRDGFAVILHTRSLFGDAAAQVQKQLAAMGIRIEVRALGDAEFFDLLRHRQASFWLNRFGCASGDASDFLNAVVHSRGDDARFGLTNYGGYRNPKLDEAIERSAGIDRVEARLHALQQMMGEVMDDLPIVPLYNDQDVYALDRSLSWEPRSDSLIRGAEISLAGDR